MMQNFFRRYYSNGQIFELILGNTNTQLFLNLIISQIQTSIRFPQYTSLTISTTKARDLRDPGTCWDEVPSQSARRQQRSRHVYHSILAEFCLPSHTQSAAGSARDAYRRRFFKDRRANDRKHNSRLYPYRNYRLLSDFFSTVSSTKKSDRSVNSHKQLTSHKIIRDKPDRHRSKLVYHRNRFTTSKISTQI